MRLLCGKLAVFFTSCQLNDCFRPEHAVQVLVQKHFGKTLQDFAIQFHRGLRFLVTGAAAVLPVAVLATRGYLSGISNGWALVGFLANAPSYSSSSESPPVLRTSPKE